MPLPAVTVAGLIVVLGSAWEFWQMGGSILQKVYRWISLVVALSGVLYAAYVSITVSKFFPFDRLLVSGIVGVILGVADLSLVRKGTNRWRPKS
jgi:hypothetical protein